MKVNIQNVLGAINELKNEVFEEVLEINMRMKETEKKQVAVIINVPTIVYLDEDGVLIDVIDNTEALLFHSEIAKEIDTKIISDLIDKTEEINNESNKVNKREKTFVQKKLA